MDKHKLRLYGRRSILVVTSPKFLAKEERMPLHALDMRTLIETLQCHMTLTVQLQSSTDAWLLGLEFTASNCLFLREGASPVTFNH